MVRKVVFWDCESSCDYCEHKTRKEALQHAKLNEEYNNEFCKVCNDGTTNKECHYICHKISVGMMKEQEWVISEEEK